ncbi:LacI family DNA-binding transcriptional regulator [Arthrobacter sp. 2RAF6]|uniref:LacI family DNA-binding transcriptional regulator n=1 Tax=Arthrobacter sp. 2RAF6 TaxID=3233002 RepID=UPI003F8FE8A2
MWEWSRKSATVDDVARLAGVSKATAGRVLGRYGSSSVTTRAAVHAAAAALDYRPNAAAKTMNTSRSELIGVISPIVTTSRFALVLDGITAVCREAGMGVITAGSEYDVALDRAAIELLLNKRVDAIIASPAHGSNTEHLHAAHRIGVPIVLLERHISELEVPTIESDTAGAGRKLGRHLRSLGHTRVGYISTSRHPERYRLGDQVGSSVTTDRLQAIYGSYAEAAIRPSTDLVRFTSRSPAAIQQAVIELLGNELPPTALIADDEQVGLEMLTVIRSRSISIPRELSLVMLEDTPWATLIDPPLTVVRQPTYDMGRTAAVVALASIGAEADLPRVPLFPAELLLRKSVGPAPP